MSTPRHRLTRSQVANLPTGSPAELLLSVQLEQAGIPFLREFRFAPHRKWRADFVVAKYGSLDGDVLIEIDGGGFVAGRHARGAGIEADCEKQSAAAIRGYRVMRVTPAQVNDGRALAWVKAALGLGGDNPIDAGGKVSA